MRRETHMRDKKDKKSLTIKIMAIVIAVLVLFVIFTFVVRPQMLKYNDDRRLEGVDYAVSSILLQIQSQGYAQLSISENQSVILTYVTPEELQFLTQVRQQQAAQQVAE